MEIEYLAYFFTDDPFAVLDCLVYWEKARLVPTKAGELGAAIHFDSQERLWVPRSGDRIIAPRFLRGTLEGAQAAVEEWYANGD